MKHKLDHEVKESVPVEKMIDKTITNISTTLLAGKRAIRLLL